MLYPAPRSGLIWVSTLMHTESAGVRLNARERVVEIAAPSDGARRAGLHALALAAACAIVSAALFGSLRPVHLYAEDCFNFARSLKYFDPFSGRPQFPGYPLFVLQSKMLLLLTGTPESAFRLGVILAGAIALCFATLLARAMSKAMVEALPSAITGVVTGGWIHGVAAALLLVVNPVFLFAGLTSTIRLYLAAVSSIVAYCCWRMWQGDRRWILAGSLALGFGSGYRPELIALLFPLWAVSSWRASRRWTIWLGGLRVLAAASAVWIAVLLHGHPDPLEDFRRMHAYLADQARGTSLLYGSSLRGWLSMLARLAAWNGIAIAGWIAAAPFAGRIAREALAFLGIWVAPVVVFHATVHVGNPGHTLASVPAFCVLGAIVIAALCRRSRIAAVLVFLFAITLNWKTFRRPFSMHPERATTGPRFFREEFIQGLWAMSWPEFRRVGDQSEDCLRNVATVVDAPGPVVIVWMDSPVIWQKISYYFPRQPVWVLENHSGRLRASRHLDIDFVDSVEGEHPEIPLENATRVLWITADQSGLRRAVGSGLRCLDRNTCWSSVSEMRGLELKFWGFSFKP